MSFFPLVQLVVLPFQNVHTSCIGELFSNRLAAYLISYSSRCVLLVEAPSYLLFHLDFFVFSISLFFSTGIINSNFALNGHIVVLQNYIFKISAYFKCN